MRERILTFIFEGKLQILTSKISASTIYQVLETYVFERQFKNKCDFQIKIATKKNYLNSIKRRFKFEIN